MEKLKNKKVVIALVILLLICLVFFFTYEAKFTANKTTIPQSTISIENSYYYINPLKASGNGTEKIRLTVMVLSDQGIGIEKSKIAITGDEKLAIESVSPLSDQYGQAIFDISTSTKGVYEVSIAADSQKLPQTAKLSFY